MTVMVFSGGKKTEIKNFKFCFKLNFELVVEISYLIKQFFMFIWGKCFFLKRLFKGLLRSPLKFMSFSGSCLLLWMKFWSFWQPLPKTIKP